MRRRKRKPLPPHVGAYAHIFPQESVADVWRNVAATIIAFGFLSHAQQRALLRRAARLMGKPLSEVLR